MRISDWSSDVCSSDLCEGALKNFYAKVAATPETSKLFSSRQAMDRVAAKQTAHWTQLFSGPPNERYFQAAEAVGQVHARAGLEPSWYIGGYALMLEQLISKVMSGAVIARLSGGRLAKIVTTLVKTALLDADIAISSYFAAEQASRDAVVQKLGEAMSRMAAGDFSVSMDDLPEGYSKLRDRKSTRLNSSH